jgi:phosphoglycerol transferase MdoB-like AlkP superfamily enzyme
MPIRYLRKLFFALALLLPSVQSQLVFLLSINLAFLIMLVVYRPSKTALTNYVCIFIELMLVVLECLCFAYDKLIFKTLDNQTGFADGMLVVEGAAMLTVLGWIIYRLGLVISETDVWKKIHAKLTANTHPEYLKEQQRKRDL